MNHPEDEAVAAAVASATTCLNEAIGAAQRVGLNVRVWLSELQVGTHESPHDTIARVDTRVSRTLARTERAGA